MHETPKSITERVFHALLYEFFAITLSTPLFAWLSGTEMMRMGTLNMMISAIALLWNMVFNAGYDRLIQRLQWQKTPALRVAHGIAFEGGLGLLVIPLSAWWLHISLYAALVLDIGLLLFFMPYTVAFNWLYDIARARYLAK
ncbi:MAG: multidrug/biocide efflux PACE transporter [Burkholderiales bacterium]|nr:multidrug/biocide efflux PACE transporter [Burkholderiales bacterium]